jgi:hypothetical protein
LPLANCAHFHQNLRIFDGINMCASRLSSRLDCGSVDCQRDIKCSMYVPSSVQSGRNASNRNGMYVDIVLIVVLSKVVNLLGIQ